MDEQLVAVELVNHLIGKYGLALHDDESLEIQDKEAFAQGLKVMIDEYFELLKGE